MIRPLAIRNPLVFGLMVGAIFFCVVEVVLIVPPLLKREELALLKAADTISLLSGTVTAIGLAAVWAQMLARAADARRSAALQFGVLHAHFSSREMREHRNVAWVYLSFLSSEPVSLRRYAQYCVNDTGYIDVVRQKDDLRRLFSDGGSVNSAYDSFGALPFVRYDAAVNAMMSFFVRLSVQLRQNELAHPDYIFDDDVREAVGPFFWHSYWRDKLMPLAEMCVAVQQESHPEKESPCFVGPLRRLTAQLQPR